MAELKKLSTRIINKHATAEVWNRSNFIPLQGELIIYDPGYDSTDGKTYRRERLKIGDGQHLVQELPFVTDLKVNVGQTTNTITVVTSVSDPSYTSAEYVAPSMSHNVNDDILTVTFDAGKYTPASFKAGSNTSELITYITDVDTQVEIPVD